MQCPKCKHVFKRTQPRRSPFSQTSLTRLIAIANHESPIPFSISDLDQRYFMQEIRSSTWMLKKLAKLEILSPTTVPWRPGTHPGVLYFEHGPNWRSLSDIIQKLRERV